MKIPQHYVQEIVKRVHAQAEAETSHDVQAIYAFILPSIRAEIEREVGIEPNYTLGAIKEFVEHVTSVNVKECCIKEFYPTSEIYGEFPAAVVKSAVVYNNVRVATFDRCIWVLQDDVWYTTALHKMWT